MLHQLEGWIYPNWNCEYIVHQGLIEYTCNLIFDYFLYCKAVLPLRGVTPILYNHWKLTSLAIKITLSKLRKVLLNTKIIEKFRKDVFLTEYSLTDWYYSIWTNIKWAEIIYDIMGVKNASTSICNMYDMDHWKIWHQLYWLMLFYWW